MFLGFPSGSDGKEATCNMASLGSLLGWEDPLDEGLAIHSSILARRLLMDSGAWQAAAMGLQVENN